MSSTDEASSPESSARHVLRDMWAVRRGEAVAEIETLEEILESLARSSGNAELRLRAQHLAHQLAGVFGVFGFVDLKAQMARIDIDLSDDAATPADLVVRVREIIAELP